MIQVKRNCFAPLDVLAMRYYRQLDSDEDVTEIPITLKDYVHQSEQLNSGQLQRIINLKMLTGKQEE